LVYCNCCKPQQESQLQGSGDKTTKEENEDKYNNNNGEIRYEEQIIREEFAEAHNNSKSAWIILRLKDKL
jgi:hypothetical protein